MNAQSNPLKLCIPINLVPEPSGDIELSTIEDAYESQAHSFDPWEYALKPLIDYKYSGWFPRGRLTLVSGASGAMKTTFVGQALLSGRERKCFLGHEGGGLSFQFLFLDRGRFDAEETFDRMGVKDRIPFLCINGCGYDESLRAIEKEATEYTVLFIDGADLLVGDSSDGGDVGRFTTACQRIAEHYGTAMVLSTGASKLSAKLLKEGAERRSITKGSEVWGRTGGSVFTLNSEHDGTKDTRLLVVQHRNAPTERFLLRVSNGLLEPMDEKVELSKGRNTALEWVLGQKEFTRKQFMECLRCSGKTASERLNGLIHSKVIKPHTSGRKVWYTVPGGQKDT